jgi:cytochrome c-type biogenesis protein CcmF
MGEIGHFSLALAWLMALVTTVVGAIGGYRKSLTLTLTARNAQLLACFFTIVSVISLGIAFLSDDYSLQYVWQFSSQDMPLQYKFSAIWGGMDGSMLLWCAILSLSSAVVALQVRKVPLDIAPWMLSFLSSSLVFFTTITLFVTNPFRYINAPFLPPGGEGLNPLLQNPYMAIHPPMLYLGFTTFTVPYAFCMGALCSGRLTVEWIRLTRVWTLLAWAFLTVGITLGSHWAYIELGWGGFWAWDPVENSSFLPWLTATAFLHSAIVQDRKGLLKTWNIWLISITYGLTVFGTFLTRSGIVQSVHSFAETDVGWVFLVYLSFIFVSTLALTIYRRKELIPNRSIDSFFSREAAFLVNNLILLSITFAVIWGVMFPVLSEALTGEKQTIGIPFFNKVTIPLFLLLILTMGIGPLISWRRASFSSAKRIFLTPTVFALIIGAIFVWAGVRSFYTTLSYALCTFVFTALMGEFHRGVKSQKGPNIKAKSVTLLKRHRSRYAGYLVHFGVVIATIGITASMAHKQEQEFSLKVGEVFTIDRFRIKLNSLEQISGKGYSGVAAEAILEGKGKPRQLKPEMRLYTLKGENTSEVALAMGLREDVYLVLAGVSEGGKEAYLKVFINPLQIWLWIGVIVMIIGTLIALPPPRWFLSSDRLLGEMI